MMRSSIALAEDSLRCALARCAALLLSRPSTCVAACADAEEDGDAVLGPQSREAPQL